MPARTAHLLRPANSDHGAGCVTCVTVPFYSKSVTVIIHHVTPPTHISSRTRGCSLGQRPLITVHVPQTVPLMSAIKAGHVRDTSVIRVQVASASRCGGVRELDVRPPAQVCHWSRVMLLRAQLSPTMSAGPTYVRVVRFGGRSPAGTTSCNLDCPGF